MGKVEEKAKRKNVYKYVAEQLLQDITTHAVSYTHLVKLIIKELGASEDLIEHVKDRPGHDRRYAIDNTKITSQLGWKPEYTFERGIHETIQWYLENEDWLKNITSGAYEKYYENMYK